MKSFDDMMSEIQEKELYEVEGHGLDNSEYAEEVVYSGDTPIISGRDILIIDLDGEVAINRFQTLWPKVLRYYKEQIDDVKIWKSASGENLHVLVKLDRGMGVEERHILQLILGNDPVKALLDWRRMEVGTGVSMLRQPKDPQFVIMKGIND